MSAAVSDAEAEKASLPAGAEIPLAIRRRVERALCQTVGELISRGIITSGDTLARLLPQMTSGLRAGGIRDRGLRYLYAALYRAFRGRRSLLLIDLQKQVQIEELPWVAIIESFRDTNLSTKEVSRRALEEVASLTLTSFPQAILPNKLLQEMGALAKGASVDLPLVDEIAADIFMGRFSPKFTAAAKITAGLLEDSLYSRYYDIDFSAVLALPSPPLRARRRRGLFARPDDTAFAKICSSRAGVKLGGWDTVANGLVLEQQQILTTQNLAAVFSALDLRASLSERLGDMAWLCMDWICNRHQMKIDDWHAKLIMVKNTAYAWRQMLFYLSLAPEPEAEAQSIIERAKAKIDRKDPALLRRFRPALQGLEAAASGNATRPEQRFLGWTRGRHWLLPEEDEHQRDH